MEQIQHNYIWNKMNLKNYNMKIKKQETEEMDTGNKSQNII